MGFIKLICIVLIAGVSEARHANSPAGCPMSHAEGKKYVSQLDQEGSLRLGLLKDQALVIPAEATIGPYGFPHRCSQASIRNALGGTCKVCLKDVDDLKGETLTLDKNYSFKPPYLEASRPYCGDNPTDLSSPMFARKTKPYFKAVLEGIKKLNPKDFKSREDLIKELKANFALTYPETNPFDFRPDGSRYGPMARTRRQSARDYLQCLERGHFPLRGEGGRFSDPINCMAWLVESRYLLHPAKNFTFLASDIPRTGFLGTRGSEKIPQLGWGTRLLFSMACKDPKYKSYRMDLVTEPKGVFQKGRAMVKGKPPEMEVVCESPNFIGPKTHVNQMAMSFGSGAGKKELSFYRRCFDLKPQLVEAKGDGQSGS